MQGVPGDVGGCGGSLAMCGMQAFPGDVQDVGVPWGCGGSPGMHGMQGFPRDVLDAEVPWGCRGSPGMCGMWGLPGDAQDAGVPWGCGGCGSSLGMWGFPRDVGVPQGCRGSPGICGGFPRDAARRLPRAEQGAGVCLRLGTPSRHRRSLRQATPLSKPTALSAGIPPRSGEEPNVAAFPKRPRLPVATRSCGG